MAGVALIEYFTHDHGVDVALVHPDLDEPLVVPAGFGPDGRPLTRRALELCARRLVIDFHGLPRGWDEGEHRSINLDALQLSPAVNPAQRLGPITERKMGKPQFRYTMTYWRDLGEALLPPPIRPHLANRDLLCVVPHGPLHGLPFAALGWDEATVLADRFGVCLVPSATVLKYCQLKNPARQAGRSPRSAFVAGIAAVDDQDPTDLENDGSLLRALLPTEELAGARGTTAADHGSIVKGMQRAELIHLACHGVFGADAGQDPMKGSGLLVAARGERPRVRQAQQEADRRTGSFISAQDVLGLDLSAAMLVTLRACSSGRSEVRGADELFGMARAFLYAGVPSLLVSLWDVHKRSSMVLLEAFYTEWLGGTQVNKWQALSRAQRKLRASGLYEDHLYHWASFVLVGDWI